MNRKYIEDRLIELCSISSLSLNERKVADSLIDELVKLGFEVVEDDAGSGHGGDAGNVIATKKGNKEGSLLFSAHMDTVGPCEEVIPILRDGVLYSDGTSVLGGDDKGGIVAILAMVKKAIDEGVDIPSIKLVFSIAEEIGMLGAKEVEVDGLDYGFIIDSSGLPGNIIVKAPYAIKGKLEIIGKKAHAGIEPEKGINALVVASEAISKVKIGRIDEVTTSNIGVVKGGSATNIVMEDISLDFEARSQNKESLENYLDQLLNTFEGVCVKHGAKFSENLKYGYKGFNISEDDEIIDIVKGACKRSGVEVSLVGSGGGSDANIYNEKGLKTVNLACGMSKVHTTEEYIELAHVEQVAEILYEIVKEY